MTDVASRHHGVRAPPNVRLDRPESPSSGLPQSGILTRGWCRPHAETPPHADGEPQTVTTAL